MPHHLNPELSTEIREATSHLPLYENGPGVDYTHAEVAYATSVTLLHVPGGGTVDPASELLLVQRGCGDWYQDVWGDVSGYVDTVADPKKSSLEPEEDFDPIAFTVRAELAEECGLPPMVTNAIELRHGKRFTEQRFKGRGIVHMLPTLGIYRGEPRPLVRPDGNELTKHIWVPLNEVVRMKNLSPGYMTHILPNTLGTLGLRLEDICHIQT